jgi:choline dehydrogenase-like flavoprotein
MALYLNNRTGPFTKAQSSSAGFLSLEMITDKATALVASLKSQDAASYLPKIYKNNSPLLAGFKAQRDILAKQINDGSVAVVEVPFGGAGSIPNALQKPLSRGTIYLDPTNPKAEPIVTHRFFENPFDKDQLFASVQFTRQLMSSDALAELDPVELLPGPQYQTRDAVFDALLNAGGGFGPALAPTFAHPSSSCPMMPQKYGGCVSSDLLLYGTKKLSIVDASILPIIPAAHLQASLYAVGEKAADLIKKRN